MDSAVGCGKTEGPTLVVGWRLGKLLGGSNSQAVPRREHRDLLGKEGGKDLKGRRYKGTKTDVLW